MLTAGQFERRIRSAGTVALLAAVVFLGGLVYWQAFRADLGGEDRNPRVLASFANPLRGRILDRDGNELVASTASGARLYRDSSLAHVLGYIDPRYGSQGAELVFNDVLSGEAAGSWRGAVDAEFRRAAVAGSDIRLTIKGAVQAAAAKGLGDRRGAVVAIDPKTGEVLAMVSVPAYDPGSLDAEGEALLEDSRSPLLNRATQGLYPPGSIFKTVTAASALENRVIAPGDLVTCPGEIVIDGFPISCDNVPQGTGTYPFRSAFTFSVNAVFAQVGVAIGWARLEATAQRFGFESPLDFTLDTAAARLRAGGGERTATLLASTAFGQGELLVTPLQMAVIAAAVANGGLLARPHLGLVRMDGKRVAGSLEDAASRRLLSEAVAAQLRDFMVSVVDSQQAAGVAIAGVKVGGKTGTAETGTPGVSHAWFIGFAPADDPKVAVAVIVENGGRGGEVAAPIAGAVMRAALAR